MTITTGINCFRSVLLKLVCILACWFLPVSFTGFQNTVYIVDGTWYREDGAARKLFTVPEGIKMITEEETFIYLTKGENVYQMNWTPGRNGTKYRWTLTVKSLTVIENTYENDTYPGKVVYKYTRILQ